MADQAQQQVAPVNEGQGAPHQPAPANPVIRSRVRRQGFTNQPASQPQQFANYRHGQGTSSLLARMDAYNTSVNYMNAYNVWTPNFLPLKGAIFLANQRLANHDRFLKDTSMYHPWMDEAYLSFLWFYHTLRCRRNHPNNSPEIVDLLGYLEQHFPPQDMHIPGYAIPFFMSITEFEAPFENMAPVIPALPSLEGTNGHNHFQLRSWMNLVAPCPILMLDQVRYLATQDRTGAHPQIVPLLTNIFGHEIADNHNNRWVAKSVHYRLPTASSARVDTAFCMYVQNDYTNAAGRQLNPYKLDIPARYTQAAADDRQVTWLEYLGLVQYQPNAAQLGRLHNWPNQYSAIMSLQCQYIDGSRPLNTIPTTGLGAAAHVSRYPHLPFPEADQDPNTPQRRTDERVTNLIASLDSFDVQPNQVAAQHAAISQIHVTYAFLNGDANDGFSTAIHSGPLWNSTIFDKGPEFDTAVYMYSNVPLMISSVALRQ